MRIGQVAQEAPGTEEPLIEIVLKADTERLALMTEEQTATDPHRIAEIHMRLADIDAHSAEARAATILAGLGFDTDAQKRPASSFSGGWRMRVALASVLFAQPDLLLLDEPTNYLDLEGTLWLERLCRALSAHRALISHDRDLLEPRRHLDRPSRPKKLTFWRGGYDQFERQRARAARAAGEGAKSSRKRRANIWRPLSTASAPRPPRRGRRSRGMKALERMEPIAAVVSRRCSAVQLSRAGQDRRLADHRDRRHSVGYEPGKPVLKQLTLRIDADDRIALLGANGNGKSTFAKLLARRLPAMDGTVTVPHKLKVAYFAQHQLDELRPKDSVYDHVRRLMPDDARSQSTGESRRHSGFHGKRCRQSRQRPLRRREGAPDDRACRLRRTAPGDPR